MPTGEGGEPVLNLLTVECPTPFIQRCHHGAFEVLMELPCLLVIASIIGQQRQGEIGLAWARVTPFKRLGMASHMAQGCVIHGNINIARPLVLPPLVHLLLHENAVSFLLCPSQPLLLSGGEVSHPFCTPLERLVPWKACDQLPTVPCSVEGEKLRNTSELCQVCVRFFSGQKLERTHRLPREDLLSGEFLLLWYSSHGVAWGKVPRLRARSGRSWP